MTITRKKLDISIDDKILIGMIISTEYLGKVKDLPSNLIQSLYAQTVARWCLEYFKKYNTAPSIHIKEIYERELSSSEDEDTFALIGMFLGRISNEYEKAPHINAGYLFDETKKYMSKRLMEQLHQDMSAISDNGDDEDVLQLFEEYNEDLAEINENADAFLESIQTSSYLIEKKVQKTKAILYPWLREKSLNMIFAERGLGKSWLAMIIAIAVTRREYEDIEVGPWYVKNPCGVLLMDGEMGEFDLQDRLKQLAGPLGDESRKHPLNIFSASDFAEKYNTIVNLYSSQWQDKLYQYFQKHRSIRILILDNLSSLCSGRDENDNQTTSVFTAWLIKLKALGVSVIIVHHQGKMKGTQRGASALEDPLNNTIYLSKSKNYDPGGGAQFLVSFTKTRHDPGGSAYRSFELQIVEHEDNSKFSTWIIPEGE